MAAWNDVPSNKVAGNPLLSEEWNQLVDDLTAMAEGADGAPRIVIPTAITTTETDQGKVLRPDGANGVAWGASFACMASGDSGAVDSDLSFILPTESYDSAGMYDPSTGVVTIIGGGLYFVTLVGAITQGSFTTIELQKDSGSGYATVWSLTESGASLAAEPINKFRHFPLNAGDKLRLYHGGTGSNARIDADEWVVALQ